MGRLDPSRRSVPLVTATTEDWLWFQLSMLDEDEEGSSLNSLGEVLMGYGERYFEGGGASTGAEGQAQAKGRTGLWASVLMMTGQFERVGYYGRSEASAKSNCVLCCRLSLHYGITQRQKLRRFIWLSPSRTTD